MNPDSEQRSTTAATSMTVSGSGAQTINSPFALGSAYQTLALSNNLTLGGAVIPMQSVLPMVPSFTV